MKKNFKIILSTLILVPTLSFAHGNHENKMEKKAEKTEIKIERYIERSEQKIEKIKNEKKKAELEKQLSVFKNMSKEEQAFVVNKIMKRVHKNQMKNKIEKMTTEEKKVFFDKIEKRMENKANKTQNIEKKEKLNKRITEFKTLTIQEKEDWFLNRKK